MARLEDLPPEILRIIAQLIYLDHLPRSLFRCIDPHGLPSTYPDGRLISSTQHRAQATLHALCLTNARLYHAAKPLLWRRLQIKLPYTFLLLLRSLGASRLAEAYEQQHTASSLQHATTHADAQPERDKGAGYAATSLADDRMDFNAMLAAVGLARVTGSTIFATERMVRASEDDPSSMDLVWIEDTGACSGAASRYQVTFRHDDADVSDVHKYPRVLDFSTFTTQGMRRTVGEGQDARFVTPAKLLALITAVSRGLMAFGASSSMDSALSLEVLEALLFRDGENASTKETRTLRGVSMERSAERKHDRRRRLESLDLCHCVSPYFEAALARFVDRHLRKFSGRTTSTVFEEEAGEEVAAREEEEEGRGRSRRRRRDSSAPTTTSRSMSTRRHTSSMHPAKPTYFPSVQRLGLHGVHFSSDLLSPFVAAFPRLTHLDLAGTKIDDAFLQALAASPDMELESLSLAGCPRITSGRLTELLVDSPVCAGLIELSLEGSLLFPTPITREDLQTVITTAPCMRSGMLRYLDVGGCGMTDDLLDRFPRQPTLLDLGLAATPSISLECLSRFLIHKAPNVQVLELVDSCHDPRDGLMSVVRLNGALLEPCTTVPSLSISEQLAAMGFAKGNEGSKVGSSPTTEAPKRLIEPRTNLRVLGLSMPTLRHFGALGNWRAIFGKGRRGWLVDITSGPNPEAVDEDLKDDDEELDDEDAGLDGVASQLAKSLHRAGEKPQRGRDFRRGGPAAWEPETPPRRASRSPSLGASLSRKGGSSFLGRGASHSHSRSRSRAAASTAPSVSLPRSSTERADSRKGEEEDELKAMSQAPVERRGHVIREVPKHHPRRLALERLVQAKGHVPGTTGWHSRKMEVLLGLGMLGRESGLYAYAAYQA